MCADFCCLLFLNKQAGGVLNRYGVLLGDYVTGVDPVPLHFSMSELVSSAGAASRKRSGFNALPALILLMHSEYSRLPLPCEQVGGEEHVFLIQAIVCPNPFSCHGFVLVSQIRHRKESLHKNIKLKRTLQRPARNQLQMVLVLSGGFPCAA